MLDKQPQDGLLNDSDQYRTKVEAKELCDLGNSVQEKYGPDKSWKYSLRQDWDSKMN